MPPEKKKCTKTFVVVDKAHDKSGLGATFFKTIAVYLPIKFKLAG